MMQIKPNETSPAVRNALKSALEIRNLRGKVVRLEADNKALLEALKEAVDLITQDYTRASMADGYWPAVKPMVGKFDAAIAQATGEKQS